MTTALLYDSPLYSLVLVPDDLWLKRTFKCISWLNWNTPRLRHTNIVRQPTDYCFWPCGTLTLFYWYGQLVGHQPWAVYLCMYVCMTPYCSAHDEWLILLVWPTSYETQFGLICICAMERYIINGSFRVRSTNGLRVTPPISMKFGTLADNA